MTWQGPIKTIVDLDGPDSPGAAPFGASVGPGVAANTALVLLVAASNSLPARPSTAAAPSFFLAQPSAPITTATNYVAQVPGGVTPGLGGYYPGDTVRILFTAANGGAAANVTVQTGPAPTTIGEILSSKVTAVTGLGYIDIQLNAAGTAWAAIGGGYL